MPHLHGPRVIHGARTARDYEAKQHAHLANVRERFGDLRRVHPATQSTKAFVNEGRWVILCPACHAGAAVDVEAGVSRCFECGAVYTTDDRTLRLPAARWCAALDNILGARPDARTRNWTPGESLLTLRRENLQHHLPKGAR